jgi:ABC-2 type transport system permease protein
VFYFLIMITLFLGLSVLWLRGMTDSRSRWFKAGRYVSLVTALLLLGYSCSRPAFTFYYDATVTKRNTLTPETQALIQKVKKPLRVTMYANLFQGDADLGLPEMLNNDMAWWDSYIRFMPEMQFDYINYYDSVLDLRYYTDRRFQGLNLAERAKKVAYDRDHDVDLYLPPDEIHKLIELKPELNLFVRQLGDSSGLHKTFLRMFHDPMHVPSETEVATAMKRLVVPPPKVVFVTGHSERSIYKKEDRSYRAIAHDPGERGGLINQGFDVDSITLDQDLPAGIAALVIADPTHPYTQDELQKIQRYVAAGGNLLVIGHQGNQALLNPLLKPLGVQLMEGMLVANSKDLAPDEIFVRVADSASLTVLGLTDNWLHHGPLVYAPGSVGLRYTDNGPFAVHPFLLTHGEDTWNKLGAFKLDTGNVSYNPEHGDDHSPLPVALALTRKIGDKEQRIMVLGNANWMDNEYLERQRIVKTVVFNFGVAHEVFKWFCKGEFPLRLSRKDGKDTTMLITRTGLRPLTIFFQWVLPGLLLVFGTILLIRRKRK